MLHLYLILFTVCVLLNEKWAIGFFTCTSFIISALLLCSATLGVYTVTTNKYFD